MSVVLCEICGQPLDKNQPESPRPGVAGLHRARCRKRAELAKAQQPLETSTATVVPEPAAAPTETVSTGAAEVEQPPQEKSGFRKGLERASPEAQEEARLALLIAERQIKDEQSRRKTGPAGIDVADLAVRHFIDTEPERLESLGALLPGYSWVWELQKAHSACPHRGWVQGLDPDTGRQVQCSDAQGLCVMELWQRPKAVRDAKLNAVSEYHRQELRVAKERMEQNKQRVKLPRPSEELMAEAP